jgi:hypothetical protein
MARTLVAGLLAAVGTFASGLAGLVHGGLKWMMLGVAAAAAGVGACLAALQKNIPKPAVSYGIG